MQAIHKALFIITTLVSSSIFAFPQYNPTQLQQFNEKNVCLNCDLSNAIMTGNHSGANLANSNLTDTIGTSGNFSQADFSGTNMSGSEWMTNLSYVNFKKSILANTTFDGCNLESSDFTGAIVNNISFRNADLLNAAITPQQLALASNLCNATLPDGTKGKCK